jgi:hypothetical protein
VNHKQYAPWSEDPDPDEHSNIMNPRQSKRAAKKVGELMDRQKKIDAARRQAARKQGT